MDNTASPRRFLSADWRYLVMLNFEVDPAVVQPFVPGGTEIDLWQGRTFLSLVGFRFERTRVLGMPIPWHRNFEEVNLRFYVRRLWGGAPRRGVVFIKELVPRRMIAWVARTFYNENYVALPMHSRIDPPRGAAKPAGSIAYDWFHGGRWHTLAAEVQGEPLLAAPGSEEEFITEHYWGYVRQRDQGAVEYGVEHPRWRVWNATAARFDCAVAEVYGAGFASCLARPPTSAFVAEGSPVLVRKGLRVWTPGQTT